MVNKRFWIGILVVLLVFGITIVGCRNDDDGGSNPDPALNGTWVLDDGFEFKFNNGNYESGAEKGTYTTNGSNITMTTTHIYNSKGHPYYDFDYLDVGWYTKAEIKASDQSITDEELNEMFSSGTTTYSISGNKLTFAGVIFTKIN